MTLWLHVAEAEVGTLCRFKDLGGRAREGLSSVAKVRGLGRAVATLWEGEGWDPLGVGGCPGWLPHCREGRRHPAGEQRREPL
jgi:hypothetical protein